MEALRRLEAQRAAARTAGAGRPPVQLTEPTEKEPVNIPGARLGTQEEAGPTLPAQCVLMGDGLHKATMRKQANFNIETYDAENRRRSTGGDQFFVAVRGSSRVRARVADNDDGTYTVTFKPSVSGKYSIAVSLFGESLPGSPFALEVISPQPDADKCELRGDALSTVIARTPPRFRGAIQGRVWSGHNRRGP